MNPEPKPYFTESTTTVNISTIQSDARLTRRLWLILIAYEALVISIVAGAGLNISLAGGGSLYLAAPLLLIACAEMLRLPLSALLSRLRWFYKGLAIVALLAIAIGSFEGLAVAFEAFLQNRVVEIMHAGHAVEQAQQTVDAKAADQAHNDAAVASLVDQVRQLDTQVATLAHEMPAAPAASNRTCTGKKGKHVSCSADTGAVAAYSVALKAYNARLAELTGQRSDLQAKVDTARQQGPTASPEANKALSEAKETFEEAAGQSPVWRLTAAIFHEDVVAVTQSQFNTVKKYAVAGLASSFALLSMTVSMVTHSPLQGSNPGKLGQAMRAYLARRRKRLVIHRDVPGSYRDRVIVKHVPVNPETGLPLNPNDNVVTPLHLVGGKS